MGRRKKEDATEEVAVEEVTTEDVEAVVTEPKEDATEEVAPPRVLRMIRNVKHNGHRLMVGDACPVEFECFFIEKGFAE